MRRLGAFLVAVLTLAAAAPSRSAGFGSSPAAEKYTTDHTWAAAGWSAAAAGASLDLTGYALSFDDEFTACDIAEEHFTSEGQHNWYAVSETLGFTNMVYPSSGTNLFSCAGGQLGITLSNPGGSQWQGGLVETEDRAHEGFFQLYGVFEARMTFPSPPTGLIPWPTFWLKTQNNTNVATDSYIEMDVVEPGVRSSSDLTAQETTLHEFPGNSAPLPGQITAQRKLQQTQTYAVFDGLPHVYDLKWTPAWFIYYRDGIEVGRLPVLGQEMRVAAYPLLSLAIFYDPSGAAPGATYTMSVDDVRAFACASPAQCR